VISSSSRLLLENIIGAAAKTNH